MSVDSERKPRTRREAAPRMDLTEVAGRAVAEFKSVTGLDADAVTGIRSEGDGWSLLLDVTELERVPATSSVIATYRVDVDRRGRMTSCERLRRFSRNATD